eukprot:6213844-Pleurochrysis_carterae.AAC.2
MVRMNLAHVCCLPKAQSREHGQTYETTRTRFHWTSTQSRESEQASAHTIALWILGGVVELATVLVLPRTSSLACAFTPRAAGCVPSCAPSGSCAASSAPYSMDGARPASPSATGSA